MEVRDAPSRLLSFRQSSTYRFLRGLTGVNSELIFRTMPGPDACPPVSLRAPYAAPRSDDGQRSEIPCGINLAVPGPFVFSVGAGAVNRSPRSELVLQSAFSEYQATLSPARGIWTKSVRWSSGSRQPLLSVLPFGWMARSSPLRISPRRIDTVIQMPPVAAARNRTIANPG